MLDDFYIVTKIKRFYIEKNNNLDAIQEEISN